MLIACLKILGVLLQISHAYVVRQPEEENQRNKYNFIIIFADADIEFTDDVGSTIDFPFHKSILPCTKKGDKHEHPACGQSGMPCNCNKILKAAMTKFLKWAEHEKGMNTATIELQIPNKPTTKPPKFYHRYKRRNHRYGLAKRYNYIPFEDMPTHPDMASGKDNGLGKDVRTLETPDHQSKPDKYSKEEPKLSMPPISKEAVQSVHTPVFNVYPPPKDKITFNNINKYGKQRENDNAQNLQYTQVLPVYTIHPFETLLADNDKRYLEKKPEHQNRFGKVQGEITAIVIDTTECSASENQTATTPDDSNSPDDIYVPNESPEEEPTTSTLEPVCEEESTTVEETTTTECTTKTTTLSTTPRCENINKEANMKQPLQGNIVDLLNFMTSVKNTFFHSFFEPAWGNNTIRQLITFSSEQQTRSSDNEGAKDKSPSLAGMVKKLMAQLSQLDTKKGFVAVVRGGRLSDLNSTSSELICTIRYLLAHCDMDKTTIVVTGACPSKKACSLPLFVAGPFSSQFKSAEELTDIFPIIQKAANSNSTCGNIDSAMEARNSDEDLWRGVLLPDIDKREVNAKNIHNMHIR